MQERDDLVGAMIEACVLHGERSWKERAEILLFAYMTCADNVRAEASVQPGGFEREQAAQVSALRRLAVTIEADHLDLDAERLVRRGDFAGLIRHFERRFAHRFLQVW